MSRNKTGGLAKAALFSALISVCAWMVIPSPVPFTMQTFGVLLAAAVLGGRGAAVSVIVYILVGLIGLPVFSGGTAGIGVIMGVTGGYIIGFLPCAYIVGCLCERTKKRPFLMSLSMAAGLLCDYVFGVLWFFLMYSGDNHNIWTAVTIGVLPFVIPDILKVALAAAIATRLRKIG